MTHSRLSVLAAALVLAAGLLPARAQLSPGELSKIREAAPVASTVKPRQPRLLLIFNLSEGYKHSVIPRASQTLELMGKKTGAYETVQSEDISQFRPENLKRFDAVCFNNTTQLKFDDPELRRSLLEFVAGGKGIVGLHAASDNFPTWPEGQELIGGVFDGHPWTADGTWAVKIADPGHPLNAAFQRKDFLIKDEIYRVRQINLRKNSRVLLALDMKAERNIKANGVRPTDRDIPISWVRSYGKGRFFYCSLGHNDEVYTNPAVLRHYLDGIQFALGDYQVDTTPLPFDPMGFFDETRLKDLLGSISTYRHGASRAALADLNTFIRGVDDLPEARLRMEKQFLEFLRGNGTPAGKQFVCSRLAFVGSEESVPQLSGMLADTTTADMALLALESIPGPAADAALREALNRVKGRPLVGVISALGNRRVESAATDLQSLIIHPDMRVAGAAVSALGKIETPAALDLLERSKEKSGDILDAMLSCADRLSAEGNKERALVVYKELSAAGHPIPVRSASLRGIVLADPGNASAALLGALRSRDTALHATAAKLVGEVSETDAIARLLPELPAATQVQLLASLAQHADSGVRKVALAAAAGSRPEVRIAALRTLGSVGDAGTVAPLARIAATAKGAEQKEARASLSLLHAPGVDDSIVAALPRADSKTKVELIKGMAERRISSAVPLLLQSAKDPSAPVRLESAKTLKSLAADQNLPVMVDLLLQARDDEFRKELELAVAATARRSPSQDQAVLAVYPGVKDKQGKGSLISVLGKIGAPASLPVLRTALNDRDPEIRLAGIRALSEWPTPEPYADLWPIATGSGDPGHRTLALRGAVRLIGLDSSRTADETVTMYREAMKVAPGTAERKLLLSAVGEARSVAALRMAAAYLNDKELHLEAEAAMLSIAGGIADTARREAVPQLQQVIASSGNATNVDRAKALIKKIEQFDDYITSWESAGPYRKAAARLLNEPFAPELSAAAPVQWSPFHSMTDPKKPWLLELDKAFSGDDNVVYVRTNLLSPSDQKARLEVGSDYGIKVWLNGKMVHTTNIVRKTNPGDDLAPTTLQKGWNTLMMKLEQGDGSWSACARMRAPDGGKLEGIRVSTTQN